MTTPRGPRNDVRTDAAVPDIPGTTDAMLQPDPITGRADPEQTDPEQTDPGTTRTDHRGVPEEPDEEKPVEEWVTGEEPMTGPQRSYLATLAREAGEELPERELTKAAASRLIERLQRATGRIPADRGR